jgi:ADP-heptose:LPS heptosyltransferase
MPIHPVIPHVKKIAVLRANALGDFIFALPALIALKAAYPEAHLSLLGQDWHAAFLQGRPGPIDRVIVIPPVRGVGAPTDLIEDDRALSEFFAQMRQERFDLAFQLHGGGRYSNPFVQRLGARCTIGLKAEEAPALDINLPYLYFQNEVVRLLEVTTLAGASLCPLEPHLEVIPKDQAEVRTKLALPERPLVVLQPGATDPRRRWAPQKFAQVGNVLAKQGAVIAINGTALEAPIATAVANAMQHPALDLSGVLSLNGLAGLLSQATLVVSNDTGPLHLAAAVGAATVGIYWFTNAFIAAPLTVARHRRAISWRIACPVCGVPNLHTRCGHQDPFVDEVEAEDVSAMALDLFVQEEARQA